MMGQSAALSAVLYSHYIPEPQPEIQNEAERRNEAESRQRYLKSLEMCDRPDLKWAVSPLGVLGEHRQNSPMRQQLES